MTLIVMGSESDKDSCELSSGGDFDERVKDLIPSRITIMIMIMIMIMIIGHNEIFLKNYPRFWKRISVEIITETTLPLS